MVFENQNINRLNKQRIMQVKRDCIENQALAYSKNIVMFSKENWLFVFVNTQTMIFFKSINPKISIKLDDSVKIAYE